MAGVAGLEPTNAGVKVPCLTAWLHPIAGRWLNAPTRIKTGWMMGIEPTNAGATIRCVSHFTTSTIFNKAMCQEGLEPPTLGLEGRCSIQLSYWHTLERVMGIEPT